MGRKITLQILKGEYAVGRLDARAAIPAWADGPGFMTITRTDEELSIVCLSERMPTNVRAERGWVCLKFVGPFAFDETGIVLAVVRPLSEGSVGVFVVSTFDGDHLMVKRDDLTRARALLLAAGHALAD